LNYLSVCSGIEAATVAWHPLGWRPAAFAEIEKFPSAVLAHHYSHVPNLGDMTKFKDWPDVRPSVLVGGTPCQSFSVAGLRKGMADPRGNLALTYLAIADQYRPEWLLWENVPGVLSSNGGRDFGSFLGGMVELGYGFAYRVLDAQYVRVDEFGRAVPQRRRRVFVVGNSRSWRRAAAVLFERESLSWNSAPSRKTGQGFAADAAPSLVSSGRGVERAGETQGQDPVVAVHKGFSASGDGFWRDGIGPLRARAQDSHENVVAHALRGEGFDASEDGTGRGTPVIPIDMRQASRGATMTNNRAEGASGGAPGTGVGEDGDPSPTIASSHVPAIGYAIQAGALRENPGSGPDGVGVQADAAYTLEARAEVQAVAFDMRGREGGAQFEGPHDTANIRAASGGSSRSYVADWAVRRLTPREEAAE
jgi:DNA (cytosine-5)-methyltransferase 1